MIIRFIAVTAFLVATAAADAQVKYGINAGVNMASWKGDAVNSLNSIVKVTDGYLSTKGRTGFHAGGYVNIPVGSRFSIEPGLQYSQKGYAINGNLDIPALKFIGANAGAQVQSHYIDVPLLVRAEVAKGFSVYAGPQFSYLVKNNLRVDAGVLGISLFRSNLDITDAFKRIDAGIAAGARYRFTNGFLVQAGYDHGLSRVDDNGSFKSFNRVVKVGVGFEF
jgi:Outer membrane protein beta-barrel domain